MANTKSAQKQVRQNEKRRLRNLARRTAIKTAIKKVIVSIEEVGDTQQTRTLLSDVSAKLARAKSKGLMHANTASRKLSRLAKRLHKKNTNSQTAEAQK